MAELLEGANGGVLEGYLTAPELAQQLRKHKRTIRRYAVEMGLPSIVIGKTRLFRREAVVEWLRSFEPTMRRRGRRS